MSDIDHGVRALHPTEVLSARRFLQWSMCGHSFECAPSKSVLRKPISDAWGHSRCIGCHLTLNRRVCEKQSRRPFAGGTNAERAGLNEGMVSCMARHIAKCTKGPCPLSLLASYRANAISWLTGFTCVSCHRLVGVIHIPASVVWHTNVLMAVLHFSLGLFPRITFIPYLILVSTTAYLRHASFQVFEMKQQKWRRFNESYLVVTYHGRNMDRRSFYAILLDCCNQNSRTL